MSSGNKKRKHRISHHHDSVPSNRRSSPLPGLEVEFLGHHESYQQKKEGEEDVSVNPLRFLYIQAHEADIPHGSSAAMAAQSLEVFEYRSLNDNAVEVVPKIGSALIPWGSNANGINNHVNQIGNEDDSILTFEKDAQSAIWVDRYDVRLLLDITNSAISDIDDAPPASPSGWSDIPSDAEDTFFFTPDEMDDFHREKRRRLLEKSREERLHARLQEDGDGEAQDSDVWGGSDEEPDEVQRELMRRTAAHLTSSPNPAQLEMRILANHGSDQRFAFLRGRWKHAWNLAKAKVRMEKEKAAANKSKAAGMGVLAGYGSDSDGNSSTGSEDNEDNEPKRSGVTTEEIPLSTAPGPVMEAPEATDEEEMTREARRKRLKLWAERRKAAKDGT